MPSLKSGHVDGENVTRGKRSNVSLQNDKTVSSSSVEKVGKQTLDDPKRKKAEKERQIKPTSDFPNANYRQQEDKDTMNERLEMMQQEQRDEVGVYPSQKKISYRRVRRDENGDEDVHDEGVTLYRKLCGPLAVLLIACVIALSQLQLTFETVSYSPWFSYFLMSTTL